MAETHVEKFKKLLAELFMFDQADLDFGIYRIMNAKRDEITRFLDTDLLPQVRDALGELEKADRSVIEAELAKAIDQAKALGADPESLPKVKELRQRLSQKSDLEALEREVFSDLYNFFRRYYSEGDFLSLRRYKEGVYAVPYEGEEVKLHWANADQYYIKTAEYFRDYTFKLSDGRRVHFKLAEADTEQNNNKPVNGQERRFILRDADPIAEENGELVIFFEYRRDAEKHRQADLNVVAVRRILEAQAIRNWLAALAEKAPTEKNPNRTILERHLADYTARNTFDYFIHKDLGGFLRRELDFYVKNEVMHLDDIESEATPRVEQYLAHIRAIRRIAYKIIDLLAQIENFQKKLWLKKKFVIETNYCISVGHIPEELISEVAANEAQREEWVRLMGIDKFAGDLTSPRYSEPLTPEFLKAHITLMVDTRHFPAGFTARLLSAIPDLDDITDGLLVRGENFQTLALLETRYKAAVDCIYIDPPYNTDASAIDYKNGYKASSWMSLIKDRVGLGKVVLTQDGIMVVAIDDEQFRELSFILSDVFNGHLLGTVCVRSNPSGRPTQTGYSVSHDYLLFAGQSDRSGIGRLPPTDEQMARFSESDQVGPFEWRNLRREGSNSDRSARRRLYYPIYICGADIRVPPMSWDESAEEWNVQEQQKANEQVVWPDNEDGVQKTWRWEWETVMSSLSELSVRKDRRGMDYVYYKRRPHEEGVVSVSSWFDAKYSATEHGSALLKDLFGFLPFSYPKSIHAVVDALYVAHASKPGATVLDYFAGSGTTGHAVVNLNREYGGHRKFILAESGLHFDTVLLPRLKKVTFTPDWKDGMPKRVATKEEAERSPRILKVLTLESYDDSLNNLELKRTREQGQLIERHAAMREDYVLHYMLDVESAGSASLLDPDRFEKPFDYKLNVRTGDAGETRPTNVDLVETFNCLIGLRVKHVDTIRCFRVVQGINPASEKVLVIWRNTGEKSNAELDDFFLKQGYNPRDMEFDLIYVNGDNNLENLKRPDETWKVRLIEEEFKRLMFDVQDL